MSRIALVLVAAVAIVSAQSRKAVVPPGAHTSPNFSPGILAGDTLYISGTTGTDPKSGKISDNFEDEVKQALTNIGEVLHAAKMDYANAVAVQVYLTDMDLFPRMNTVYQQFFKEPRPSRTTVGVAKLAGAGAHVEITVTARK